MNKIIKIISIVILVLMVSASVISNLYYIGWKNIESKLIQKGAYSVVNTIVQTVKQQGEIKIGDITLIIKP